VSGITEEQNENIQAIFNFGKQLKSYHQYFLEQSYEKTAYWKRHFMGDDSIFNYENTAPFGLQFMFHAEEKFKEEKGGNDMDMKSIIDAQNEKKKKFRAKEFVEIDGYNVNEKRQVVDSFCGAGKLVNATDVLSDRCGVYHTCYVHTMECLGDNYTVCTGIDWAVGCIHDENNTYVGEWNTCNIKQLMCAALWDPTPFIYTLPEDDVCHIIRHNQNNTNEYINQVQVLCGYTLFGYEVFNFECYSEEVICDPDCHIEKLPCLDLNMQTSICQRTEEYCYSGNVDICSDNQIDRRYQCNDKEDELCLPTKVNCDGNIVDYTPDLDIFACDHIEEISCTSTGTHTLPSQSQYCKVVEVVCGSFYYPFISNTIPDGCYVAAVSCFNLLDITDCLLFKFGCGETCTYLTVNDTCSSHCYQEGPGQKCRCPLDYTGNRCETIKPSKCTVEKISPVEDCEESDLFNLPVCNRVKKDDIVEYEFSIDCTFVDNITLTDEERMEFNYLVDKENFALTVLPGWRIGKKIFNMEFLSDGTYLSEYPVTAEQLQGTENLKFTIPLSELVNTKFITAGRVYIEFYLTSSSQQYFRRDFLDVTDLPEEVVVKSHAVTYIVIASLGGLGLIIIAGIILFIRSRNQKNDEEEEELTLLNVHNSISDE
jgi:hypothetical protein